MVDVTHFQNTLVFYPDYVKVVIRAHRL